MRIKILVCTGLFLLLSVPCVFAGWEKRPEFRWQDLYRYDADDDHHQLFTSRVSLTFDYSDKEDKSLFKLTPFFEARWNIDQDLWERKELGMEIGKDIFNWFYLGEAIQKGWMKEDYRIYGNYEKRDYTESETRLLLHQNLLSAKYLKLKGFILNEFTYDFNRGAGTRNEVAIGLISPITKFIETSINWRHIDRIHDYDSDDTFEVSVTWIL